MRRATTGETGDAHRKYLSVTANQIIGTTPPPHRRHDKGIRALPRGSTSERHSRRLRSREANPMFRHASITHGQGPVGKRRLRNRPVLLAALQVQGQRGQGHSCRGQGQPIPPLLGPPQAAPAE